MAPPPPSFDTSRVSPSDAVVTTRSLRRRFAEAFDQAEGPDQLVQRSAGGLSPVERAAWTAQAMEQVEAALHQILVADNPSVALPPVDPAGLISSAGGSDTPAAVLAHLGDVASSLADTIAEVHGDDWSRPGQSPSGPVSALDIARLGVRIGVEHLRAAEAAIGGASNG